MMKVNTMKVSLYIYGERQRTRKHDADIIKFTCPEAAGTYLEEHQDKVEVFPSVDHEPG
jgi:hypothetical protein